MSKCEVCGKENNSRPWSGWCEDCYTWKILGLVSKPAPKPGPKQPETLQKEKAGQPPATVH